MVVAVSGGPDSVVLARAFKELQPTFNLEPLILAHLNHQLRGEESNEDESFVAELAGTLSDFGAGQVRLAIHRVDVRSEARRTKDNLEKVAREVRYRWLAQVAREAGARWIATGHTADDQAETVLHRLLRGSGLQGLRGIAPHRELRPGVELIRPMLSATRADVLAFLQEIGQPFREDHSNFDRRFTRNRLRHDLLPQLAREYNPDIHSNLARLAEQAADAFAEIEARAAALLAECELPRTSDMLILDRTKLAAAPRHLLREALRLLWRREGWPCDAMRFEDWDSAAAVACGEVTAADLPGRVHMRSRGRVVQLSRAILFED